MSSATDKMIAQFSNLEDLSAFAKAQQNTLIQVNKKNKALEDEIKHLKKLLEGTVPVINPNPKGTTFSSNDEESIAREQLFLLKQKSTNEELSYEEAKKVDIYSKILNNLKTNKPPINVNGRVATDAELLTLMKGENDG